MNKYYFLFILIVSLIRVSAGGLATEMLSMCRNIEGGLHEEFLLTGKSLPASLREIELLNEIYSRNPRAGLLINEMSVVPDAPRITQATGISRNHFEWRIFAIGRTINTDYGTNIAADGDSIPGRYTLWLSPDGKYCSPGWTPETEIQAALKQIGGFDPSKQPVAFPDAEKLVMEKDKRDRKNKEIYEWEQRENKIKAVKSALPTTGASGYKDSPWTRWLALVMPFLALIAWLVFRLKMLNAKGKGR